MAIKWLSPQQYPLLNANHKNIEEAIVSLNNWYGRGEVEVIDFAWCYFVRRPFGFSKGEERQFSLKWNLDRGTCTVKALGGHQRTFKANSLLSEEDTHGNESRSGQPTVREGS